MGCHTRETKLFRTGHSGQELLLLHQGLQASMTSFGATSSVALLFSVLSFSSESCSARVSLNVSRQILGDMPGSSRHHGFERGWLECAWVFGGTSANCPSQVASSADPLSQHDFLQQVFIVLMFRHQKNTTTFLSKVPSKIHWIWSPQVQHLGQLR